MADVDGCTVLPNSSAMEVEFMYQQQLAQSPGGGQEIADSSEKSKMLNGGQRRTKGLLR